MSHSKAWSSLKSSLGSYASWSFKPKKKDSLEIAESELQEFHGRKVGVRENDSLFDVDELQEVEACPEVISFEFNQDREAKYEDESSRICQILRRFESCEDPRTFTFKAVQERGNLSNSAHASCSSSRDLEELSDADTMSAGQMTPTVQPLQSDGLKGASGKALCCWHVIEDSDTLSGICIRYGISEDALLRANRASRAALLARKSILIPLIENMEC
jgi:hypothetical protein